MTQKELKRLLKSLPRKKPVEPEGGWPGGEAPKFVPFEELVDTLDADKDGDISLDEWLTNLAKLPGLKAAIEGAIDPATGKVQGYLSLEQMLDETLAKLAPLEAKAAAGGGDAALDDAEKAEAAKLRELAAKLRASVGSAGLAVFRQVDLDHSGKIDRKELMRVLKQLPKPEKMPPGAKKMSLDEIVAVLDVDGDGVIDEAEWLAQLEKIPALKASIEQAVDPATGKIVGYRTLEEQLAKVMRQAAELEAKAAAGEDVAEELEKRRAQVQKLVDAGITPAAEPAAAAPAADAAAPAAS